MSRLPRGERVRGPYYKRGRSKPWRVRYFPADGGASLDRYFATEEEAERFKTEASTEIQEVDQRTVASALQGYWGYLGAKGNKASSITRTQWSIKKFLDPEDETPLDLIRARTIKNRYAELTREIAIDSHRNALAELKTFFRWARSEGLVVRNPAEGIQGIGKRNHGKPQLRAYESRIWLETALERADAGHDSAVGAMMTLLLGLRAQEVTLREVRDVDYYREPGDTLWIPDSKTRNGRRRLEVPVLLRQYLLRQAMGRPADAWLFPGRKPGKPRDRGWPNKQVKRLCRMSNVPQVCAHSMRGAHATLAFERGMTGSVVAAALGQGDERVTRQSYAKPGSDSRVKQRRLMTVLEGGRR